MLMYYGNAPQAAGVRGPALRREGKSSLGKRSGNRDGRSDADSVTYSSVAVAVTGEVTPLPRWARRGQRGPHPQPGPPPGRGIAKSSNDFCTERPRALISARGGAWTDCSHLNPYMLPLKFLALTVWFGSGFLK